MSHSVFIQANARQMLGAKISAYSYKRNSKHPDSFDVQIISAERFPRLMQHGQSILRDGHIRNWDPDDLQSFTPLRFVPPTLMAFEGRAVVTDPDCFGVSDVAELLAKDMQGKAIYAVPRAGHNRASDYLATSVMLLDCASSIGLNVGLIHKLGGPFSLLLASGPAFSGGQASYHPIWRWGWSIEDWNSALCPLSTRGGHCTSGAERKGSNWQVDIS